MADENNENETQIEDVAVAKDGDTVPIAAPAAGKQPAKKLQIFKNVCKRPLFFSFAYPTTIWSTRTSGVGFLVVIII